MFSSSKKSFLDKALEQYKLVLSNVMKSISERTEGRGFEYLRLCNAVNDLNQS